MTRPMGEFYLGTKPTACLAIKTSFQLDIENDYILTAVIKGTALSWLCLASLGGGVAETTGENDLKIRII